MKYDSQQLTKMFEEWRKWTSERSLPEWSDFPTLELYMDQVTVLINRYLEAFESDRNSDSAVTPAMINNYVKMKIIPPPVKKRYTRIHLAYLVMVCTLKQTLSMEMIRRLLPTDLGEDEVRQTYQTFVSNQKKTARVLFELLDKTVLFELAEKQEGDIRDLVLHSAVFSNLSRSLTRRLLLMAENGEQ